MAHFSGQYHQPLSDVQEAHQRYIQAGPAKYNTKSLGRATGNRFIHQHNQNAFHQTLNDPKLRQFPAGSGSVGRQNGTILAPPRTPLMGQQIRERRHMQMQQPPRPKSR